MKIDHFNRIRLAATVLALVASAGAHADLMTSVSGGAAVYDATTNLTWVSNANLAATNTFGVGGINPAGMSWATANSWIAGMNAANYLGYNNWALPTTLQPDTTCSIQGGGSSSGFGCTGSQMGNLFYNALGGVAGSSITTTHNANYNLFSNVQSDIYWSGTEYALSTKGAWDFDFYSGLQDVPLKDNIFYALAVRPGQGGAAVPEPAGLALFGIGLLGLMAGRRRLALR